MRSSLLIMDLHDQPLNIWTIDFETYYENSSKGYSLTNRDITSTLYIRDPRFKAHGAAVVDPDGFSFWVTHKDLQCFFDSIDWSKNAFMAHNCAFDGLIAHEHYGVKAAFYLDTMSMSYGEWSVNESASLSNLTKRLKLEGKIKGSLEATSGIRNLSCEQERALVPYAIQDAEQCRKVFEILYFDKKYPLEEIHLIDLTMKMYVNPVLQINAGLCEAEIELEETRIKNLLNSDLVKEAELTSRCKSILGTDGVKGLIRSPICFAELLQSRGIVPPKKHAKDKDGEFKYDEQGNSIYTFAFAKTDIELQSLADDSRVSDLVAARLGVKSTMRIDRANRFLAASEHGTRPIPVPLRYCGAHTTRWSGCLTSENYVTILRNYKIMQCSIVNVENADLVWDGEEFVTHDGVVFSGIQEVIEYDGIIGTPGHRVFTEKGEYTLEEAKTRNYNLKVGKTPKRTWINALRSWISFKQFKNLCNMCKLWAN